ncbi:MAG: hypothetical protein WC332_11035, partial [Clostridia bacterium]
IFFAIIILAFIFSGCVVQKRLVYPSSDPNSLNTNSIRQDNQTASSGTAQSNSGTDTEGDKMKIDITPAEKLELELVKYNGGFFSIDLPSNWVIETTGEYQNFGFHAYDPQNTDRKIFFYGNMRYFMKSNEGKAAWQTYMQFGGYSDAAVYADAPVLNPATTEQFFNTFDEYVLYAAKYGINHNFPEFDNLQVLEKIPRNSPISSNCIDDSILRVIFDSKNVPCEGLFAAGVSNTMTAYMYNADAGYYTVYVITGISAPADEFIYLQNILTKSIGSFNFTDSYMQQGVDLINQGTQLAIDVGQSMSQSAQAYNDAWYNRDKVNDTISQKRSDTTLGYERVYDSATGEVYRAEIGFFDEYDSNRDEYSNQGIQRVPDNGYDYYSVPITGYINK